MIAKSVRRGGLLPSRRFIHYHAEFVKNASHHETHFQKLSLYITFSEVLTVLANNEQNPIFVDIRE